MNRDSTTTTVTSSTNPSVFGQTVTFTATVKAVAPGSGTPTGSVTFMDGSTAIGTGTLKSTGVATFTTSSLPVGLNSITAFYSGAANFSTSRSAAVSQQVNQASTTTALTSSANPSKFGQSITFKATISVTSPGHGTPTGTVTFYNGTTVLGTGSVSGGIATFTTSSLSVGTHSIKAVYSGNSDCQTSTSAVLTQVVNQSAGSSPAVAMGPSVVDQVLAVENNDSQYVLIGDLAFDQVSSTKPRRK